MPEPIDLNYWKEFLNNRAGELGLEKNVVMIKPSEEWVEAVTWGFQVGGDVMMLGWNVEEAEATLRGMAGAQ